MPSKPVKFLNTVMNGVEMPKKRDGVESPVSEVKADVCYDDDLDDLEPDRLRRYGGAYKAWHKPPQRAGCKRNGRNQSKSYWGPVEHGVNQIV